MSTPRIDLALLHNQVYNKQGKLVTTCITGFDLHDIARTARTYGVGYYLVNEIPAQQAFAKRVLNFWQNERGETFNPTRAEAIRPLRVKSSLEEVVTEITEESGIPPLLAATSAKQGNISYPNFKEKIKQLAQPLLLLFGTGWGLSQELLNSVPWILEPIQGNSRYNHLSVRSAIAIILDRLLGNYKGVCAHVYSECH